MNASNDDALDATDLALERGGRLLFEHLAFRLMPGGALLVTGPNGAGKSSLLRLIAGLLEPAAGRVDNPFTLGLQAGEPALKPDRRLGQELKFWASLDGSAAQAVEQAAAAMAIDSLLDLPCGMLSAGQRQRAALARVMGSGARLWLLDEPTAALDSASEALLLRAVAAHRAKGGLVVAVTHHPLDLADAQGLRIGA